MAIPQHLKEYAKGQISHWALSAVQAMFTYEEDVDYVVKIGKDGYSKIEPVDNMNTGEVQATLSLSNGLHENLQMKHSEKLRPESIVTCYISNMEFRYTGSDYPRIYGLTGTLGSARARTFLTQLYPIDLFEIPACRPSQLVAYPDVLAINCEQWLSFIVGHVQTMLARGRAVLLINSSIRDSKLVREALISNGCVRPHQLHKFNRPDDPDECRVLNSIIKPGEVIVATNVVGRGADFRLAKELVSNSGLHVILTFMPENTRTKRQGIGRAGRQGQPGSGQLIVHRDQFVGPKWQTMDWFSSSPVAKLERIRDAHEEAELDKFVGDKLPLLRLRDELFVKFCKFFVSELSGSNEELALKQVEDLWGMWLCRTKRELMEDKKAGDVDRVFAIIRAYDAFVKQIRSHHSFFDGSAKPSLYQNPTYLVRMAKSDFDKGEFSQATPKLERAIELDAEFAFPTHYLLALVLIQQGHAHFDKKSQQKALTHLKRAAELIRRRVCPKGLLDIYDESSGLGKQLRIKDHLLRMHLDQIGKIVHKMEGCSKHAIVRVNGSPINFWNDVKL